MRRLVMLAAALAALVAFAALARPESSPSSRLRIGESETEAASQDESPAAPPPRRGASEALLRPLDPSTLADVPANLLGMGVDEWPVPSADGALLALVSVTGGEAGVVEVVDARTFQPVVTVDLDGAPITGFLGFTPEADAVVVQGGSTSRGHLLIRYPLDPREGSTTLELPEGLEALGQPSVLLTGGRVGLLAGEGGGGGGEPGTRTTHVLVVDLLAEQLEVDVALPGAPLPAPDAVTLNGPQFHPGLAWDPAGERLYLVHADRPRVTVVDLTSGAVLAEADLESRVPGTDVVAVDGSRRKDAQVSTDGSRLYVTGRDYPGNGPGEPIGLSVIDTATLTEVGYVDVVSDWVQLSPDGRWLAWTAETLEGTGDGPRFSRVGLLDAETLEQVALLGNGYRSSYALGFSRDSAHFYLQSDDSEGGVVVRALGLPSLEQTGFRRFGRDAWFEPGAAHVRENS